MILLVSPTKTMKPTDICGYSQPVFNQQANQLMNELKTWDILQIKDIFKVNDKIATTVYRYYQEWQMNGNKQALHLFDGLQFKSMDIRSWDAQAMDYANNHLYIMSGLYGILKASDSIRPYRLDFTESIRNQRLDAFYKPLIVEYLKSLKTLVIDACSKEYQIKDPGLARIELVFLDHGKNKATIAKQARGYFTHYFVQNKVDTLDKIKAFNSTGFQYDDSLSNETKIVFNKID